MGGTWIVGEVGPGLDMLLRNMWKWMGFCGESVGMGDRAEIPGKVSES